MKIEDIVRRACFVEKNTRYYSIWGILSLLLGMLVLSSCGTEDMPVARMGVLDADGFFSDPSQTLYLEGEWEFYPDQLLSPEDFDTVTQGSFTIVPGIWGKDPFRTDKIKFATYRLKLINHGLPSVFSIRNHKIFSAFKLYLNGEVVLANGTVAFQKDKETPFYQSHTVSLYKQADTLEFVLQVSSHHYRKGGIAESFEIGTASQLQKATTSQTGVDFFLMGGLLIMALYYLGHFLAYRRDHSSLYFSIFIFIVILRILVTGQRLLLFLFPGIPWEVMLKLEYGTFYIAPIFFILFFNALFREEIKISVVNWVMLISITFTLFIIFIPATYFTYSLMLYQLYVSVLAILVLYWLWQARKNQQKGATLLLLGVTILFISLTHDMIFAYGNLKGTEIFPAGLITFIILQSYVLSLKLSEINKENQDLWEELDYKNQNLELLVNARTKELVQQKNLLQQTNQQLEQNRKSILEHNRMVEDINEALEKEKGKSDRLLLNVLPKHIADELKLYGKSLAHSYPQVSVLFIDFVRFSEIAERLAPSELLEELHYYFANFDDVAKKYNLEKIKTIGDAYMCAGGLHEEANHRDVKNTLLAALEINAFVMAYKEEKKSLDEPYFDCRIGIHTGPVIAGVVGKSKFVFDIWGPTVNIAKRMEAACEPGKVNISESTYLLIQNDFDCTSRGMITMKHKKNMQMFFVNGLK